MNRGILLLFLLVVVLAWLGFRVRERNLTIATVLWAASAALLIIVLAGLFRPI